jgi:hypothetical protein
MRGDSELPWGLADSSLVTDDSAMMYVVVGGMGATNGLLAGAVGYYLDMSLLNLHAAVWLFLVVWAATTGYLSYKRVPSGVLAVGLYFVGLFVLLQPIVIYGPLLAAASETTGTTRTQLLLESWQGIIWWGTLAGGLAIVIMFASRLLTRHARAVVRRQTRANIWQDADD